MGFRCNVAAFIVSVFLKKKIPLATWCNLSLYRFTDSLYFEWDCILVASSRTKAFKLKLSRNFTWQRQTVVVCALSAFQFQRRHNFLEFRDSLLISRRGTLNVFNIDIDNSVGFKNSPASIECEKTGRKEYLAIVKIRVFQLSLNKERKTQIFN